MLTGLLAVVAAFLAAHGPFLCAVGALTVSEILPFVKNVTANGILQLLLAALKKRAAPLALLAVACLASLPGCAFCKVAANAQTPRCVLEASVLQCAEAGGESLGFALVPVVISIIATAASGGALSAAALTSMLESQGVKDTSCVLAALETYLGDSAEFRAGLPAAIRAKDMVHQALREKLAEEGRSGTVDVQVAGRRPVRVVL